MNLDELRFEIDKIDGEMIRLFSERMEVSKQIAEYKKENNLPVYDPVREEKKLEDISALLPEEKREYGKRLYSLIFELSRELQDKLR